MGHRYFRLLNEWLEQRTDPEQEHTCLQSRVMSSAYSDDGSVCRHLTIAKRSVHKARRVDKSKLKQI